MGESATTTATSEAPGILAGGGEMGALMRATDWAATPLGPVDQWPLSLRMMASFLLANRFPLLLWWGPDYIQLYNDAYRPVLGAKHPHQALGRPVRECWSEIWHVIGPLIDTPFHGGPATWMEDLELEINRHGFVEESHFTVAYSPVPDDTAPRGIGGVLATVHEITEKVIGERRVRVLRDLGTGAIAEGRTPEMAGATAAQILEKHERDVPFALIYLLESDGCRAQLVGSANVDVRHAKRFVTVDPNAPPVQVVTDLTAFVDYVPPGPWSEPPDKAVVALIPSNVAHKPAGLLVAGVSARIALDELYWSFYELVTTHIATGIANARAYEEERRRAESLAELDRAKTAFFSNVSHEFRTPLTLMLGPLEEALAAPPDALDARRGDLAVVHRNSLRLLRLVNTLLDFSRIEAGRVEASYEPVDLATLTADLASGFRAATDRAGLALDVDCPPLAEPVWVDRDMWEKIILNLVSNAFKFTFTGTITVRLRQHEQRAVLTVQDTGTGIPAHELPRLFDRFYRVEGALGRTHEGTGIGLALVQELVKFHGGAVRVDSTVGEGSTFTVSLPIGSAHLPPERLRAPRGLVSTAVGANPYVTEALRWLPGQQGLNDVKLELLSDPGTPVDHETTRASVLFADDNADMREYVARLLASRYDVETVSDGVAALAAVRVRRPDLVLSDIMMPRLDGVGLVRAVRADPVLADLPVVLLSARAGEEAIVEGLDVGADDYLVKPFSARELLARIASTLAMARVRRVFEARIAADLAAMTRLHEVGSRCARAEASVEECVADILDAAVAITGAQKGAVRRLDPRSGTLTLVAQRGFDQAFVDRFPIVQSDELSLFRAALQVPTRVVVPDLATSPHVLDEPWFRGVWEAGVRAFHSTPLVSSGGSMLGIITTHFVAPHEPSEREMRLMDLLGRQAADYLERKGAEGTLETARAEAEEARRRADEANRVKSEFLAVMSHELRTPLNAIGGHAQLLNMGIHGAVTDAQREAIGRIERSEQHLLALINDILNYAKIEAGRVEYRAEDVPLGQVVADVLRMVEPQFQSRGLVVSLDIAPDITARADREKVVQIIMNLLSNAVKFTDAGGRVTIDSPVADVVLLRIADTGIGIPAEKLDAIFDPFVQLERHVARSAHGTGLGLAISRDLARGMGGELRVESVVGEGTTFTLTLPGAERAPQADLQLTPIRGR